MQNDIMTRSECLSEGELEAFVQSKGNTEKQTAWKRHLRICDDCAIRLAELRSRQASPSGASVESVSPRSASMEYLPFSGLEPNIQFGDFRIEKRLGCGGMGVVYQAHQLSLNRQVALKVLHFDFTADQSSVARFQREAQAAAKLHHPNIISIHAVGEKDGICYYVMDKVEGQNLNSIIQSRQHCRSFIKEPSAHQDEIISASESSEEGRAGHNASPVVSEILTKNKPNKLYFDTVATLIAEVADSLEYAHSQGVIHRDVKPANIMLNENGKPILMDFGIARLTEAQSLKITNTYVGTPQYMSPEQVTGDRLQLDQRTDIYSLGATLYELITLKSLLKPSDSREGILYQILHGSPRRPRLIDSRIPVDMETICMKAIEKDTGRRYQRAGDLADDLRRYLHGLPIQARPSGAVDKTFKFIRRYRLAVSLIGGMILIALAAGLISQKYLRTRWVHRQAIPQIEQKIEENRFLEAFALMQKADNLLPDDPMIKELWPQLSGTYTITTTPSGAKVICLPYLNPSKEEIVYGLSPLKNVRVPFGTFHWRIEKQGYQTVEGVYSNFLHAHRIDPGDAVNSIHFTLHPIDLFPSDMAWIPSSQLDQKRHFHVEKSIPDAPEFLIDKYEVTNLQYKEFIDHKGYEDPAYWQHEFLKDGQVLSFSEAMMEFRDQTGMPGPASWSNGTYPENQEDFPVSGVSWFEACAYARFRNKQLPTVFHWLLAAIADVPRAIISSLGNFGDGPAPVGSSRCMSSFGLYDVAGNVREWCSNSLNGQPDSRCILGGAWGENEKMFGAGAALSCWNRDPKNGFRCARYLGGNNLVPKEAFEPLECRFRDFEHFTPVSDQEFAVFIDTLYQYDHIPLNPDIESVNDNLADYRREKITIDATYDEERIPIDLFLPKNASPPYQLVMWFPGAGATRRDWTESRDLIPVMILMIQSGRALAVPHYTLTYSRRVPNREPAQSIRVRDLYIKTSKDLRRSIDYLETRNDIDPDKIAYVGWSFGAALGSVMIATEPRFKTGVFLHGGICACERHPAYDPANFAPRVKIPILMINGSDDPIFNYLLAQKPLFDLLGTPPDQKKHLVFPGGHSILWEYRKPFNQGAIDWLDLQLGPVSKDAQSPDLH